MKRPVLDAACCLIDEHIREISLNRLLKSFVEAKALESGVWSELTGAVCRMLGGSETEAVTRGAITELAVLALDIADDLQDGDSPALPWMKCGTPYSLNGLIALLMAAVGGIPDSAAGARLLCRAVDGQQLDLLNRLQDEEEYLDMAKQKAGSLVRFAFHMGYSGLAAGEEASLHLWEEAADCLGVAAQLDNDRRDLLAAGPKNDLLARKRTLPVLFLLTAARERFPELVDYFEGRLNQQQFEALMEPCRRFIEASGCLTYTATIQALYAARARERMTLLPARSEEWRQRLIALTRSGR